MERLDAAGGRTNHQRPVHVLDFDAACVADGLELALDLLSRNVASRREHVKPATHAFEGYGALAADDPDLAFNIVEAGGTELQPRAQRAVELADRERTGLELDVERFPVRHFDPDDRVRLDRRQ